MGHASEDLGRDRPVDLPDARMEHTCRLRCGAGTEEDLGTERVRFPVVNQPVHELPALVLALLAGRRTETATFELTSSELDAAITLLQPAAAATMYNHPNLQAWQSMSRRWANSPAARAFAVFVSDWEAEISSPYDAALRHQVERGEVSAPIHADVSDQVTD